MTIRENEVQRRRQHARTSTSLADLAIEIVRDDPELVDGWCKFRTTTACLKPV
jgi:hypothetical protein